MAARQFRRRCGLRSVRLYECRDGHPLLRDFGRTGIIVALLVFYIPACAGGATDRAGSLGAFEVEDTGPIPDHPATHSVQHVTLYLTTRRKYFGEARIWTTCPAPLTHEQEAVRAEAAESQSLQHLWPKVATSHSRKGDVASNAPAQPTMGIPAP